MSWLTDTLVATGALIAVVLVLRRPVARWFGPGMAYALWALPLLRLVLPPLVLPVVPEPAAAPAINAAQGIAIAAPAPVPVWPVELIVPALWLAGALAFLCWRAWSYVRMRRLLLAGARPVGEAGEVRLVETPATRAPVAFGVRDKVIALPVGFMARADRRGRDLAIAHELEHHAGRDLVVNLAMQPLLALHWFNPLAWLGWRALRRDQEAACDARVLAGADAVTRAAYARLITSFAQSPRLALAAPMACPVLGEKSIVHRLRSLTMTEPSARRSRLGRLVLAGAALTLPLTASITYAAVNAPEAPEAPEPPQAPDAPDAHVDKRVIILKKKDGEGGEPLHVRSVTRDGKTIVIKSDEPIGEAEIEARIAESEARVAESAALAAETEVHAGKIEAIVAKSMALVDREIEAAAGPGCRAKFAGSAQAQSADEQARRHARIAICIRSEARAGALQGLRESRKEIAAEREMPADIRDSVLRQLDTEIARLSKEG